MGGYYGLFMATTYMDSVTLNIHSLYILFMYTTPLLSSIMCSLVRPDYADILSRNEIIIFLKFPNL